MSEFEEITSSSAAIKAFFEGQAAYMLSGGTPPSVDTLLAGLNYVSLLTYAVTQAEQGCGYPIGVAQEAISNSVSIQREVGIAVLKKSDIYLNCIAEATSESEYFNQSGNFYAGVIKGNPTNGSQC